RSVYFFGAGRADGRAGMKELLGGKGANLAEMCRLGLPVPPGFTITTEVCVEFLRAGEALPRGLEREVLDALAAVERTMGKRFGDAADPLLVSVRSGARVSMPGMMDTVLNLGLNATTVRGLAQASGDARFAWDAYRRFVQMFGDVVLGVRPGPGEHHDPFSLALESQKQRLGVEQDTALGADDLEALVETFKRIVLERTGKPFPEDPREQLWAAIRAVFRSWNTERAVAYRQMEGIPGDWGTAVSVVAMVFGNLGEDSGTGVAFTRDPSTGEKRFYGEFLMNAQGEDVVAGIRTPQPIDRLRETLPAAWRELQRIQDLLERHYRDMQDLEFTVQQGRLYMLQCRAGKRTGIAAVRIATDMVREKRIAKDEALLRVEPASLNQLLQPVFDAEQLADAKSKGRLLTTGLNAGPGAATGRLVFTPEAAIERRKRAKEPVILARVETSPEDIRGMMAAAGILTARGGMTSHAALVARQMGRVCVAGAGEIKIDAERRRMEVGGRVLEEGDWISLDGSTGAVYHGLVDTRPSEVVRHLFAGGAKQAKPTGIVRAFEELMRWADEYRELGVRTNADQPDQCVTALAFGAEGIGLCRTEHMFFGEERIAAVREMILAEDEQAREDALAKILPLQRGDFEGIFEAMGRRPVTIRSLDPPLHEFLPFEEEAQREVAKQMGVPYEAVRDKVEYLRELNPMLGHRGCRLGIAHPEITRMQARAIFEAACNVAKRTGVVPSPEVMIPLVASPRELELQSAVVRGEAEAVFEKKGLRIPYLVGTMMELPRACLVADRIAKYAEFFSFGTNDLTQTTFGISRDDAGKFIPAYVENEIFAIDPFASLDERGVGRLMRIACHEGLAARPELKIGICGEHGGDPASVDFCHRLGLAYVSCSPYRVPIARLAAAQAALRHGKKGGDVVERRKAARAVP
ncbi:MAG TPA: pyruvate, phosphate dikinase, partial [Planctomycetota bacterium]|nr:pyruvate, phosphate dikinase [Planctomycetota bacterium]